MSVKFNGKLFQIDVAAWLNARLPKAVLTLLTCSLFWWLDLSSLTGVWNETNSAKYVGLFVVTTLNVSSAILY